jgi:hypothetical protein
VTVTRRDDTKECYVSVNGAAVNSPPQGQLDLDMEILAAEFQKTPSDKTLVEGAFLSRLQDQSMRSAIAGLLSAAAPSKEIAGELLDKLSAPEAIRGMARCTAAFSIGEPALDPAKMGGPLGGWNLTCGVLSPVETEAAGQQSLERYGAAPNTRTLAISVGWSGNIRSVLFLSETIRSYNPHAPR